MPLRSDFFFTMTYGFKKNSRNWHSRKTKLVIHLLSPQGHYVFCVASESQTWTFLQESLLLFPRHFCFSDFFNSNILLNLYPHLKNSEWDRKSHPNHSLPTELTELLSCSHLRLKTSSPMVLTLHLPSSHVLVPCKHIGHIWMLL